MTERQDELLRNEDWRFHAVGKGGTGLFMIAATERLAGGELVGFGLPSAPALFLNMAFSSYRRRISHDRSKFFDRHPGQGAWPDSHTLLFDYLEDAMSEVIFSYSAIEAVANELIPADYRYRRQGRPGRGPIILDKGEIERKVPLDEKLRIVLPRALSVDSPAGGRLWEPYLALQDMRDRIIHIKSSDRRASGPEDQTIWGRLLTLENIVFPEVARAIIGVFYGEDRRWFKLCPTE